MERPSELEGIKAKRMAEMKSGDGDGEQMEQQQQGKKDAEAANKQEEMKNAILSQVLDQNARARLSNIAVAKPEKARMLENTIINMARFGQIGGKLSDEQLKELLDRISEQTQKKTTIKFDRRRAAIDSDSD
jgi:programmed cell death protein 5